MLECYEHPPLLDLVLRSAKEDLLLISPRVTGAVINEDLAGEMRRALKRDVRIRLGYGINRDPQAGIDEASYERLKRLATDYPKLEVAHLGSLKLNTLARDDRLVAVTNFPLLSHRGDATRALGDERGWLLTNAELIADERAKWEDAWRQAQPRDFGVPDPTPRVTVANRRRGRRAVKLVPRPRAPYEASSHPSSHRRRVVFVDSKCRVLALSLSIKPVGAVMSIDVEARFASSLVPRSFRNPALKPSAANLHKPISRQFLRVSEGTRTPDRRDHNPELYQLSYAHQAGDEV